MKPTKKPVPYAERLARESVKFGLRVGGTLLRHAPGLLKAAVIGLPLAMLGTATADRDAAGHDVDNELDHVPADAYEAWDQGIHNGDKPGNGLLDRYGNS